jgi:hypothetical protein
MIDRDLAELYGVETKQLKRQVRRNIDRFPEDFMFELNVEEFREWRSQLGTSNEGDKMGLRYAPCGDTEAIFVAFKELLNPPQETPARALIAFAWHPDRTKDSNNTL